MREDVKIGVAIGVVLVVAAVLYFMLASGPDEATPTGEADTEVRINEGVDDQDPGTGSAAVDAYRGSVADATGADDGAADDGASATDDGVEPSMGGRTLADSTAGTGADGGRRVDPGAGPGIDPDAVAVDDTSDSLPTGSAVDDDDETEISVTDDGSGGRDIRDLADDTDPDTGVRDVAQPRTYVVVEGDNGFWGIAHKVYGDGKWFTLIAKANPDLKPEALRPGQKVTIPPLPDTTAADDLRGGQALEGAVTGSTTYKVQEGDLGFWGIAEKVYGSGKYFHVIEKANPGVDPTVLRPGQVLVIPPKPTPESATADTGGPTTSGDTETVGDQRLYTVQAGDNGFWGIAKKIYGRGHLWPAIKQANPDVDPLRLQPGQKLVVPSVEEAERIAGVDTGASSGDEAGTGGSSGSTTSGGDSSAEPGDRPIFD